MNLKVSLVFWKLIHDKSLKFITWCRRREILKRSYVLKKKGKSEVTSHGFCFRDSEAEQRASQFLHIYCSDINSYSSAPELK